MTALKFLVPIRTKTGLNNREHWAAAHSRVKREREAVALLWPRFATVPKPPLVARLVRIKPFGKTMDGDNLQGSLKAIRDQVAKELGVDDRSPRVQWEYAQETGPWGVRIELEEFAELPF